MIIWRNEAASPSADRTGISPDAPQGSVEITRVADQDGKTHIWYAPVPASPAGEDMPPDPVGMLTAMAGMHHEWYQAWRAAGFSEDQAYGLVTEVVRSAFTQG